MTAKVTLTVDSADSGGSILKRGSVRIALNARTPDAADSVLLETAAVRAEFSREGTAPTVDLYPNDLISGSDGDGNPLTCYTVYYTGTPGNLQPWSFWLLSTNTYTQRLSQLAEAPVETAGQQYLPASSGVLLGGVAPAVTVLTDAASITPDATAANDFRLTMTSAVGSTRTVEAALPLSDGQVITVEAVQPASGGPCSVSWAAAYNFGRSGSAPSLGTGASDRDLLSFKWDATDQEWLYLGTMGY